MPSATDTVTAPCGCVYNIESHSFTAMPACNAGHHTSTPKLSRFDRWRMMLDERPLEKQLAFNLNASRAHDDNGIPQGHRCHQILYQEAVGLLESHISKWGFTYPLKKGETALDYLYARYPAMYVLKAKAAQPAAGAKDIEESGFSWKRWAIRLVILLPILAAVATLIYRGILKLFGM